MTREVPDESAQVGPELPRFSGLLAEAESLLDRLPDPRRTLRTPDRIANSAIKLIMPHGSKGLLRDVKGIAREIHEASTEESSLAEVQRFVDGVTGRLQGLYIYHQVRRRSLPLDSVLARLRRPLSKKRARTQIEGVIAVLRELRSCEIHAETFSRRSQAGARDSFIHAYLAYCRSDRAAIDQAAAFFKQYGVRYFFDEKDISLGESIPEKVSKGLGSYSHFLLFWSHAASRSRFLDSEWGIAFMNEVYEDRPLIPVLLDDAELPAILSHKSYVTLPLGDGFTRGMAQILQVLRTR